MALVTGAGSGIGAACVRALAVRGARVVLADLNHDAARRVAGEIGGDCVTVGVDVADVESVDAMVQTAVTECGALHLAVNNAGISPPFTPLASTSDEGWRAVMRVNLDGVFHCLRAELREIPRGGAIVNMASILGLVGAQGVGPYVAAKHGVVGLTRAAALESAGAGIRVNAVAPGFVETSLFKTAPARAREIAVAATPAGRLAQPREVAELVTWLLSDGASFVTGACYPVDGGMTVQ